jgi:inhibitor of cysteine peptidase
MHQEIAIVQKDQGKTFRVHQGDSILIRLAENPTTGYRWAVDKVDEQVTALQDTNFVASGTGIGGGGTRTFTFKALASGKGKIELKLKREWETEAAPSSSFEVMIYVQSA